MHNASFNGWRRAFRDFCRQICAHKRSCRGGTWPNYSAAATLPFFVSREILPSLFCFVLVFFFFFAARREKWDKNCSTRMNCNHTIYGFSNWTGIKCESIFIGVQLSWLINSVESGENGMEKCFSTTVGEILDYLFKGWNYFYEDGREYVDPDVQFLRFFFQIISIRQMVSYLFNWSRLKFKSLEQWIYNFLCVKRGLK